MTCWYSAPTGGGQIAVLPDPRPGRQFGCGSVDLRRTVALMQDPGPRDARAGVAGQLLNSTLDTTATADVERALLR